MDFVTDNQQQISNQAYELLLGRNYFEAVRLYEHVIEAEPENKSNYWYLGLAQLLQKKEEEAQATWWLATANSETEAELEQDITALSRVLQEEIDRQEVDNNFDTAWLLRKHLKEVTPYDIKNACCLVLLSIKNQGSIDDDFAHAGLIELLDYNSQEQTENELLLETFDQVLDSIPLNPLVFEFAQTLIKKASLQESAVNILINHSLKIGYESGYVELSLKFLELCLPLIETNTLKTEIEAEILYHLSGLYQKCHKFQEAIDAAEGYLKLSVGLDKIFANRLLLYALTTTGASWQRIHHQLDQQLLLLEELTDNPPNNVRPRILSRLLPANHEFFFIRDDLKLSRKLQNALASIYQEGVDNSYDTFFLPKTNLSNSNGLNHLSPMKKKDRPKKIGYLCSCFKSHSVGWLARWLIKHHNRERFTLHGYFITCLQKKYDPLYDWYLEQFGQVYESKDLVSGMSHQSIAQKINDDDIDILVDLDSITLDTSCEVVALRPAPVQATWLGWDASGLPSIDYFIADPYVLPEFAEQHYSETIWRLPQTYLAIDGFEVGVPTLRRDQLGIPNDAVIYYSAQRGAKRNPQTVQLQLKILKEVPGSYFLIKGTSDEQAMQDFFRQLADEEGISFDRLRFLPRDRTEAVHRANLGIADVVLDTFPYNGATTTMETLWMGVPLVTLVGEQFAARNSYTMMMNAGITEGIAWSAREYIDWGVRLGKDEALRQNISWRLLKSRQTAPLWNAKKFTEEMEKAYEKMWKNHLDQLT